MTKRELFDIITKIVASPHSAIVEHDKRRAVQIMIAFDEYCSYYWQDDEDVMRPWIDMTDVDFGELCTEILNELEGK